MKVTQIEESEDGLYVWELPNGKILVDEEYRQLNIPAKKGDVQRMRILRDAARSYGFHEGKPKFLSGSRRVTDEEYEHQLDRAKAGLIPDPFDVGAMKEEMANVTRRHRK